MWTGTLMVRKLLYVIRLIVSLLKRLLCCFKRRSKSETLPFNIVNTTTNEWDSWSNKPFRNVIEEKIDEYRRKQVELLSHQDDANQSSEADFFSDMQPELKGTKKAYIAPSNRSISKEKENIFAVKEDHQLLPAPISELGDLDETPNSFNENSWDTHIDIEDVDDILKEQRRRERLEKQRLRLAEHERRLMQKRSAGQSKQ